LEKIKKKHSVTSAISSVFNLIAGALVFGGAVNMFLLPHEIVTGGATGIATALSSKWGIPVGIGIVTVNLPLFFFCIKESGISGMVYTVIGTAAASLASDALIFLPAATEDLLLSAILGGVLMGIGTGLLLSHGFTTGGSDLAAHLISRCRPSLSAGKLILLFDGIIIVFSALLLEDLSGIMYSAVCTVTFSLSLDLMQSHSRRAKAVFIISEHYESIAKAVSRDIGRGVTLLYGEGFFSGKDRPIVLCVIGRREELPLRRLVLATDPQAFMIISDTAAVVGHGFYEDKK